MQNCGTCGAWNWRKGTFTMLSVAKAAVSTAMGQLTRHCPIKRAFTSLTLVLLSVAGMSLCVVACRSNRAKRQQCRSCHKSLSDPRKPTNKLTSTRGRHIQHGLEDQLVWWSHGQDSSRAQGMSMPYGATHMCRVLYWPKTDARPMLDKS